MKTFKKILCVPTPAVSSQPTLERAVSLAAGHQSELLAIDVVPRLGSQARTDPPEQNLPDLESAFRQDRLKSLESIVNPYRERWPIECEVRTGTGFIEIIRTVLRGGFDLVIKPAENPTFVERIFGSDDMHLLRKCPCPIWLTRPDEKASYKCVLAALDLSSDAAGTDDDLNRQILEISGSVALAESASLHLAHAWDAPGEMTVRTWSDQPIEAASRYVEAERTRHHNGLEFLRQQLQQLLGESDFSRLAPEFHLQRGMADQVIPGLVQSLHADLLVMGTVARSGIPGLFIGNTAEAILEQVKCSVLAIKPLNFVSPVRLED
jgi:universal stress protein E